MFLAELRRVDDKDEKMFFMRECDNAFTKSVINRKDFGELFQKINRYGVFISLEYKGEPAGYAVMYANNRNDQTAYITLICIQNKYQGMHLGTLLMKECFKEAKDAEMKKIRLEVLKQDAGAIEFYKFCGFKFERQASPHSLFLYRTL